MIETCLNAKLIFKNVNITNSNCTNKKICLDFWVIDTLPYDIVIGDIDIQANPWLKNLDDRYLSITIDSTNQYRQPNSNNLLSPIEGTLDTQPSIDLRKYQEMLTRGHHFLKTPYTTIRRGQ